jgi:hypothetical protein
MSDADSTQVDPTAPFLSAAKLADRLYFLGNDEQGPSDVFSSGDAMSGITLTTIPVPCNGGTLGLHYIARVLHPDFPAYEDVSLAFGKGSTPEAAWADLQGDLSGKIDTITLANSGR